jgi:hypothetical protein
MVIDDVSLEMAQNGLKCAEIVGTLVDHLISLLET